MVFKSIFINSFLSKIGISMLVLTIGFITQKSIFKKVLANTQSDLEISRHFQRGVQLHSAQQFEQASTEYKKALLSNPDIIKILTYLGATAESQNKFDKAIYFYQTALSIEPHLINVYFALAKIYVQLEKYDKAIGQLQEVLELDHSYTQAHTQLGYCYMKLSKWDLALKHATIYKELQPTNFQAYLNLGNIYSLKGDYIKAIELFEKVISLNPTCANAYYNLGYSLYITKKIPTAIKMLEQALELKKDYVDAHICLAQCYWNLANFEKLWPEFAWRWNFFGVKPKVLNNIPLWQGQDLYAKTIFIYSEQGLGDTLQFIRFAKNLKEKGARVVCNVQRPLLTLLKSYKYIDFLTADFATPFKIDYQLPLLDVPHILQIQATHIPAQIPYLFADDQLIKHWKKKLDSTTDFRVGLCWHVDPIHELDKSPWSMRSIPLNLFAPFACISHIQFYSLQKINGEDQLKDVPHNFQVQTFGYDFDERNGRFMDTAAVIMNLDLVISVDTSIAHLAAALGKKVWMLLPYSADCRWYDNTNSTPWYPTMQLFRQEKPYDWQSVTVNLFNALKKEIKNHKMNLKN